MTRIYADHAVTYLRAGWRGVLPLPPKRKQDPPVGYTGRDGVWPSRADVQTWTHENPDGNIAVRAPKGVVGLDVDHYGDKTGADTITALEQDLGPLPATWRSSARPAPSGIRWFQVPEDAIFPGVLGPNVEVIQHHHRYAVVWPSIHDKTGDTYRWFTPDGQEAPLPPNRHALAELPKTWVDRFGGGQHVDKDHVNHHDVKAWLAALPDGSPCKATQTALGEFATALKAGGSRHDASLKKAAAIVRMGELGHSGVRETLSDARSLFLETVTAAGDNQRSEGEAVAEWRRNIAGAVGIVKADPSPAHNRGCRCAEVLASPADPLPNAETFLASRYAHEHRSRLVCHGGAFHAWDGVCWPETEDAALKADLYAFLRNGVYRHVTAKGEVEERLFQPNRHKVSDVLDALRAACHLPQTVTPPAWLDDASTVPADEIIACANGLLHWPTRTLHPHTPRYFAHHAVPFAFNPAAPAPERWLAFLDELWEDDPDAIDCLQEIIGYLISGDTSLQKMFLLVGPKRSGKGTIGRVVTGLLGPHHVTGPTLAGLATNFGLQALIGQPVALVSDARLRSGQDVLTERLLSVSGEDTLTVDRKHRDPWTGRLPTRFVILSNELPRLADASGALASRFVVLTLTTSFYGREDPQLTDRLLTELPGILNWALDGLERLRARGRFAPPQSSDDAIRELEDLGSPMGAFVRDRCVIGPDASAPVDELYQAWRDWCDEHGRDHPGTAQTFGRDLRAAVPGVRVTRPRGDGGRQRCYSGVRLRGPQEAPDRADSGVVHGPVRDAVRDEGAENPRSDGVVRGGPHSPHLIAREDSLDQDGNGQPTSTKARNGVDRGPPRTTDQPSPTELMIARLRREGRIPGDDVA